MARKKLDRQDVTDDTPLMLAVAAEFAFPDGTVSASSLRRERDKGHLVVSRIAGKDYTTLRAIRDMLVAARYQRSPERIAEDEAIDRGMRAVAEARKARQQTERDQRASAKEAALARIRELREASKKPRE